MNLKILLSKSYRVTRYLTVMKRLTIKRAIIKEVQAVRDLKKLKMWK